MILALGAILGLISVVFGAYATHGLRDYVTVEQFEFLLTAIRYNQVHAAVICAIGLTLLNTQRISNVKCLSWSGSAFIVGTMLFSCSIYVAISFDIPQLYNLAPIGAIFIMIAWLLLIVASVIILRNRKPFL